MHWSGRIWLTLTGLNIHDSISVTGCFAVSRMYQIRRSCIWRYFIHLVMYIIIYIRTSLLITYFQYISKDVPQRAAKGAWEPDKTILQA